MQELICVKAPLLVPEAPEDLVVGNTYFADDSLSAEQLSQLPYVQDLMKRHNAKMKPGLYYHLVGHEPTVFYHANCFAVVSPTEEIVAEKSQNQ